jgi:hypothetical protein
MADNKKMILNLFGGMQDALFLGDRFANGDFVSFLQPGQFISTSLQETDGSDDMAVQAAIANVLVDSSYVNKYDDITYSNSVELPGSVAAVYEDIMTAGHYALPYKALDPATIQEMASLKDWLAASEGNYELYRERYFDAAEAYEVEAHKQYPSAARLLRLRQKQDDAAKDWNTFGQRQLYDNKSGRYAYLSGEDPTGFWARVDQDLAAQKRQSPTKGSFYQTFLVPSITSWGTAGWASFERRISEQDSYSYSKSTSWSGGLSAGWGLWSFGGGTSGSSKYAHDESSVGTVTLKFDYLRVRIFRPWMRDDVFGYRFWTWNKTFGGEMISDGGNLHVTPPVRPLGRMPVLPQYLIVVRNVELAGSFSAQEQTTFEQQITASASVGWGPFSLSGSYSESTGSKYTKASFDGVTFRIDQPQIIARTGLLLPESPNPDTKLPWQSDAWFPPKTLAGSNLRHDDYFRAMEAGGLLEGHAEAQEVAARWATQRKPLRTGV